jgi:beta-phosphoglucomutase
MGFRGAISDVDGILVDSPHECAWRDALRQFTDTNWRGIRDRTTYSPERFTPKVYQEVMADKPRLGGATAALTYFKVPDAVNRAEAYGERKQQRVVELIEAGEFHAFPDALRFALAAASSSKNASEFLKRIPLDVFAAERGLPYDFIHEGMTLLNLFDADISGCDFEHGKPHPMIFLTAPQEPGFSSEYCSWSRTLPPGCRRARWEWRG